MKNLSKLQFNLIIISFWVFFIGLITFSYSGHIGHLFVNFEKSHFESMANTYHFITFDSYYDYLDSLDFKYLSMMFWFLALNGYLISFFKWSVYDKGIKKLSGIGAFISIGMLIWSFLIDGFRIKMGEVIYAWWIIIPIMMIISLRIIKLKYKSNTATNRVARNND